METVIHGVGFVMMLIGAISFIVLIIFDIIALFRQDKNGFGVQTQDTSPWADIIGKLPAKYLPSAFLILIGLFLYDPVLFGKFWNAATGSA